MSSVYMSLDKGDHVKRDFNIHHQQQRKIMRPGASDQDPSSPTLSSARFRGGEDGIRQSFTVHQRQELERQSVIYKYMMASMPVPPQLLIPLSQYHPTSSDFPPFLHSNYSEVGRNGEGMELRHKNTTTGSNSNRGDTEPWRCRRTDGKKWRCSRDVTPDQKYCERHSHKGRPSRSRKPVESNLLNSPTPTAPTSTTTGPTPTALAINPIGITLTTSSSSSSFDFPSPLSHYNVVNHFPRYPECDWFMKRESVGVHLCPQQKIGGLDLEVETTSRGGDVGGSQSHDHVSAMNEDHQGSCLLPRPFIEAWSLRDRDLNKDSFTGDHVDVGVNNCPASSSVLPLTLGIDHYDHSVNDDDNRVHGYSHHHHHHHQPLNWMNSTCWVGSPPGGPLAEALCLGMSMSGTGTPNANANAMGGDSSEGL